MKRKRQEREYLRERVIFRCSSSLRKKIEDVATASSLTVGDVIRRKLSGLKIPQHEQMVKVYEIRELRRELARQGGLLKHLYNINPVNKDESAAALAMQIMIFKKINLLIEEMGKNDCESCR